MRRRFIAPSPLDAALLSAQLRALAEHGALDDDAYGRRYRASLRAPFRTLTDARLLARLRGADAILVGDHRTFAPGRAHFLALVERVRHPARPLVLALSDIATDAHARVRRFLGGTLTEAALRRNAFDGDLEGQLRFEAVLPVLRFARTHGHDVLACGAPPRNPWPTQDAFTARRLAAAHAERPTAQLFVLTGQQRLAPSHLPGALRRALPPGSDVQTVLQSCLEPARAGARGVFSLGADRACVLRAAPTEVLQSHLDAVELGPGDALLADAPPAAFRQIAEQLGSTLGVEIARPLRALRVFTPGTAGRLASLPAFRGADRAHVAHGVEARESGYFPRARAVYLAGRSLNHAAEEAAHFVRHCAIGEALLGPRSGAQAFYARCLEEALAFFASRRINPARPCVQPAEWAALLRSPEHAEAAAFVLAHRAAQTAGPGATLGLLPPDRPGLVHAVTHGLGYLLGEALDHAWADGAMRSSEARRLFRDPFPDAVDAYFALTDYARASSRSSARA